MAVEATGVLYQSEFDETVFFEWFDKIAAVQSLGGEYRTVEIFLRAEAIDEDVLNEFVALYRRYHIDPAELQIFATHRLGSWFSSPDRFWHREIFDRPPPAEDRRNGELFSGDYPWSVAPTVGVHTKEWPLDLHVAHTPDHATLEATGVRFYSTLDEGAFFDWLDKNPQVKSYQGRQQTLYINVDINGGEKWDLWELAALYARYNIDMKELRVLNTGTFGPWFSDPEQWWHKAVFG
ncbi:hypothetical protein MLB1_01555 [Mycobacteroides sp. LB1]|nr:hypothetical protein [Mycobacteroides sp. LB1]